VGGSALPPLPPHAIGGLRTFPLTTHAIGGLRATPCNWGAAIAWGVSNRKRFDSVRGEN